MLVLVAVLFVAYFILSGILISGWDRSQKGVKYETGHSNRISVIIPVRNEGAAIGLLLNDILAQVYSNFEVIIVDDHSTDNTVEIVKTFNDERIRLMTNAGIGKKAAITTAISVARGAIIVTTDGDCSVKRGWLAEINNVFSDVEVLLAIGPVRIASSDFFSTLQSIEFASLIGSSAALVAFGKPTMCNGANLAYRKTVFIEVGGYEDNLQIASGDDEFLMRKVNMKYPHGSIFIGAKNAIVTTRPQATFYDFMQQRIRWASKWRFSTSIESKSLALLVLGVQMACIGALVGCLFFYEPIFPVLLITKAGLEAIFLIRVCKFLDTRWSWPAFFVLQLLYPFYVVLVGILSNLLSFRWKGRMHQ